MGVRASVILDSIAKFYEDNPRAYTSEYLALSRGQRTGYLNPTADQWDIVGRIGKTLWEDYGFRIELGNLWVFKRLSRAFKEGNKVDCGELESPFFVFELYCADNVFDIIQALRKAAKYAAAHGLDEPLDLTPPTYVDNTPPLRLYI